jgi:hypothetical protein
VTVVAPAVVPARETWATARRPAIVLLAMAGLVAIYGLLSLLNDPRGTLGTDTGGKIATLVAMERSGSFDPDIGYWAEAFDPKGELHPLYYTSHIGDRWVNVTTLPMVIAARPLFALGGERAILVLPMLGAAFSALGARALARRVGGGDGWWTFWLVGLASPLAVYALDFWEHALGVALVVWAVVFLWDVVDGRCGWKGALVSGVCFAGAATMRTEALVYAAAGVGVAAIALLARRRQGGGPSWTSLVGIGLGWTGGLVVVLAANQVLERLVVGSGIRSSRAAGTAAMAGGGGGDRAKEALTTAVGLNRFVERTDWLFGGLAVVFVAYGVTRLVGPARRDRVIGTVALAGAAMVYLLRFADGLGFVPGVLSASPLAAAGLAVGWSVKRWRVVGASALVAVPVVWVFQFSGGANPQWGGRYLLATGMLLVVGAAVVLAASSRGARVLVAALALAVTAGGVAWLSQRSHAVARAMVQLDAGEDAVLISREAHLLREGGAFYTPDRRWLTAESDAELRAASRVAREADARRVVVVAVEGRDLRGRIPGFSETRRERIEFLPGLDVVAVHYRAAP